MSRFARFRFVALSLSTAGLLVIAHLAAPSAVRSLGLDVWNLPRAEQDLRLAQQEENRLDAEREDMLDQDQLNRLRIGALIAGRVELSIAARARWESGSHIRSVRHHLESYVHDASDEAKAAHHLIELAYDECPADTREAVHNRLTREYEQAYGVAVPAN